MVQKIYSKMHLVLCSNTHHNITDLVNYGIVKNTKTWISWEWNITFLQNKNILNLCLRWHILRSYHFAVEVTFKAPILYYFWFLFFVENFQTRNDHGLLNLQASTSSFSKNYRQVIQSNFLKCFNILSFLDFLNKFQPNQVFTHV